MTVNETALFAIFPFLFVGIWLLATTTLWWLSGWGTMQEKFPDRLDAPIKRLRFQSAMLGKSGLNVRHGNCLRLDLCRGGLRVAIWRIFGPFSKPFFIPWERIAVEERRFLHMRFYRLSFGDPNLSTLTIRRRTFERVVQLGFLAAP